MANANVRTIDCFIPRDTDSWWRVGRTNERSPVLARMPRDDPSVFDHDQPVESRPVPVPLRELLRSATASVHERLHHHPGFAAVQAGTIDRAAYTLLLSRLYGFYRPFDAASQMAPERTQWLEIDLDALGVGAAVRRELPCCDAFPDRLAPEFILGARYVIEGSALGGRGMARQLDALLGPEISAGRRFFCGHGATTGAVWRDWLEVLSAAPDSIEQRAAIVAGATATFAIFEQWLAGWKQNHG